MDTTAGLPVSATIIKATLKSLLEGYAKIILRKINEAIDLVNLFINLEINLKEKGNYSLTFDEIVSDGDQLKTIGSLEIFLIKKFANEKK